MKLKTRAFARSFGILSALAFVASAHAGDPSSTASTSAPDTRYGFLNLLDHRSSYGQGVYPEPFLVDDSDLETNEFRLDWLHTKAGDTHSDNFTAEIEKGFGLLTVELEVHFERDRDVVAGTTDRGFNNVDLGARYPLVQYVSPGGLVDSTFGIAGEVGIPTNSIFSKNTELVPKVFNDLRIGSHFTMQSIFGYSMLLGGAPDGGVNTFEYGFVFGYTIPHKDLPLPGVQQLIPVFELSGETGTNKGMSRQNNLIGDIGFRVNMNAIGPVQPRLGLAFVFPMDSNARADSHWGIATSLVFEY